MSENDRDLLRRELLIRTMLPGMPAGAYPRMVELMQEQTLAKGELVFAQHDLADRIYFLVEGSVVMQRDAEAPWPFEAPSTVGVIDAVLERPRERACRVVTDARFLALPISGWFDLLEDNVQVARATMRSFARVLHQSFGALEPVPAGEHRASEHLASDASTYGKTLALHNARFLERAGLQAVASLASVAVYQPLVAGESLFEVGSDSHLLHVVTSGCVELSRAELRHRYGPGELIGGAAALCDALPSYSARAVTDATVLCIPEQDFYDEAEEHARLTRGTLAYLVTELERARMQGLTARVAVSDVNRGV